jgi:hypothetical protein
MLTASSAVMVVPSTSQCRAHRQRCPRRGRGRSPGPIRCDTQLRLRLASTELILDLLYITIFQIMVVEYYECVSLKSGVDMAFLGIYRQSWLGGRHKFAAVPGGESVLLAAQMLRIARLLGMVTNIIVGLNCNDKRVQGEVETPTVTCPICREQVSLADKDAHAKTCLAALIKAHDQADDAVAISEGDYSSIQ